MVYYEIPILNNNSIFVIPHLINTIKKKLLYLLFAVTLIGCSSDEDEIASDDIQTGKNLLIKSINLTRTSEGDSEHLLEYTYDGNKLVNIMETATYSTYTSISYDTYIYTDNLISVINRYNSEQELSYQTFLEYDDFDRLISIAGTPERDVSFVYNSDNTEVTTSFGGTLKFNSGNISYTDDRVQSKFTFDDKHSPFKNIIGNSEIFSLYLGFTDFDNLFIGANNTFVKIESSDGSEVSYTYDYNNEGYPRNIIGKSQGDVFLTAIIEYY